MPCTLVSPTPPQPTTGRPTPIMAKPRMARVTRLVFDRITLKGASMGGKSRIALLPPGFWRNSLAGRIQPESIAARCPDEDRDLLMFGLFRASHNDTLSRLHGEML